MKEPSSSPLFLKSNDIPRPFAPAMDLRCVHAITLCAISFLSSCVGHLNVSEKMMWSTHPLYTEKGAATGFVINWPDAKARGGVVPMVVTSAHVLETMGDGPLFIGLNSVDAAKVGSVKYIVLNPQQRHGTECFYVRHPDYDLAAFTLQIPSEFEKVANARSYLNATMLAHPGKDVRSGMEVSFVGYPAVLPGTDGGFPVLRSGRIASYPVGTPLVHGCFLIGSDVYPGDSGAPVFLANGCSTPRLAGMVIQRIGKSAGAFSHLAIAVDANTIRETLGLLVAREGRSATGRSERLPRLVSNHK